MLSGCWLLLRFLSGDHHELANRLWKAAAVAGFVTTTMQWFVIEAASLHVNIAASSVAHDPHDAPFAIAPATSDAADAATPTTGRWQTRVFTEADIPQVNRERLPQSSRTGDHDEAGMQETSSGAPETLVGSPVTTVPDRLSARSIKRLLAGLVLSISVGGLLMVLSIWRILKE